MLDYVVTGGETANISAAARAIGINRATLIRLIGDMEESGLLVRRVDDGHGPGLRFLRIASSVLGQESTLGFAARMLPELSKQIELSIYLVTLDGDSTLYLQKFLPNQSLVSNITIGSRAPAHLTTAGRVLLAGLERDHIRGLLGEEPLVAMTDQSPRTYSALWSLLREDRERGCAWSQEGYEPGVYSCAAAVNTPPGMLPMAISTAGPAHMFVNDPSRIERTESTLKATVLELAQIVAGT